MSVPMLIDSIEGASFLERARAHDLLDVIRREPGPDGLVGLSAVDVATLAACLSLWEMALERRDAMELLAAEYRDREDAWDELMEGR